MFSRLAPSSKILLEISRLAKGTPLDGFQKKALDLLQQYLPFDSGMWGTGVVEEKGLKTLSLYLHNSTQQMIDDYMPIRHEDTPVFELVKHQFKTIGYNSRECFANSKSMLNFIEKHEHRNIFITCMNDGNTKFTQWISLYRKDDAKKCLSDEICFLENISPHLMEALAINRKIYLYSLFKNRSQQIWGLGLVDQDGFLYDSDAQLDYLLDLEFGDLSRVRVPKKLVASLKKCSSFFGKKIVISCTSINDLFYLKGRLLDKIDRLSEVEMKVALLISGGMSIQQIADHLSRSADTIRTHSKSVYRKLQINKAPQLSEMLRVSR